MEFCCEWGKVTAHRTLVVHSPLPPFSFLSLPFHPSLFSLLSSLPSLPPSLPPSLHHLSLPPSPLSPSITSLSLHYLSPTCRENM